LQLYRLATGLHRDCCTLLSTHHHPIIETEKQRDMPITNTLQHFYKSKWHTQTIQNSIHPWRWRWMSLSLITGKIRREFNKAVQRRLLEIATELWICSIEMRQHTERTQCDRDNNSGRFQLRRQHRTGSGDGNGIAAGVRS